MASIYELQYDGQTSVTENLWDESTFNFMVSLHANTGIEVYLGQSLGIGFEASYQAYNLIETSNTIELNGYEADNIMNDIKGFELKASVAWRF